MKKKIDIATMMSDRDITQQEMANILGVSQSYISDIKNGKKPLSKKHEELLILQFGKDICDEYLVDTVDNRIMPTFKAPINGSKQQFAHQIDDTTQLKNDTEHDELIRLRIEVENYKKELSNKEMYYKAIVNGKDNELAEKNARISELQKINDFLMERK